MHSFEAYGKQNNRLKSPNNFPNFPNNNFNQSPIGWNNNKRVSPKIQNGTVGDRRQYNINQRPYLRNDNVPKLGLRQNFQTEGWKDKLKVNQKVHERQSIKSQKNLHNKTYISQRTEQIINHLEEVNYFSDQLYDVISNQQIYISQFKRKIQFDKNKASTDMQILKREIINMIDDYRLSINAQLDRRFRQYIEMYSNIKHFLHQLKNTKQQIKRDLEIKQSNRSVSIDSSFSRIKSKNTNTNKIGKDKQNIKSFLDGLKTNTPKNMPMVIDNNLGIIRSIEQNNEDYRKFHILKYLDDIQRDKAKEIEFMAGDIIIVNEFQNGFYLSQEMAKLLMECKNTVKMFWQNAYLHQDKYIRTLDDVITKFKSQSTVPKEDFIEIRPSFQSNPEFNHNQPFHHFNNSYPQQLQPLANYKTQQFQQLQSNKRHTQPHFLKRIIISPSQQVASVSSLEIPTIRHTQCLNVSHSKQISLCCLLLPLNELAVGSRDGSIGIYKIDSGERIIKLQGHKASVCSLGLIKSFEKGVWQNYLASGSDHNCNSVVIWSIENWNIKFRIESHKAAVTGILDLMDGCHFLSGSYDKKINIYDVWTGRIKYNLPTNKSSVTGVIMNNDYTKFVSCGLDNTVNVWQIIRRITNQPLQHINQQNPTKNVVETIFLQRIIENNTMICSLVGSSLRPDIIYLGTKDGKIKIIDISKGQSEKTLSCGEDGVALIQMLVLERENKPKTPIIVAFPCQQSVIKVLDSQSHITRDFQLKINSYLQFGCGVGPKCILITNNRVILFGVLSHGGYKQFNLYEMII